MNQLKFLNQLKENDVVKNLSELMLRVALAIVVWPHGAQMLLGSFGGSGFTQTMNYFTGIAGLPYIIGFLVIMIQFFGSIMLLLGFATRLNALGMLVIFIGMILTAHLEHGFFMNWYGTQQGEGYEYHLLVLGMTLALILRGAGKYSLDYILSKRREEL